jgi:hypothetical protein
VIAPVVLTLVPEDVAWTFAEKAQEPAGSSDSPAMLIVFPPATAVTMPPQSPPSPFGVATTSPAGSESLKPTPLSPESLFGFVIVKLSDVEAPRPTVAAPKDIAMVGAFEVTLRVAEPTFDPDPLAVMGPVVFTNVPVAFAVTVKSSGQAQVGPRVASAYEIVLLPVTVTVPPQVLSTQDPFGTVNPAGKVSLNAMVWRSELSSGLNGASLNVLVSPLAIVSGVHDITSCGAVAARVAAGATTSVASTAAKTPLNSGRIRRLMGDSFWLRDGGF